ncbi:MAG: transposase [Clostridiales bacterium]|nr:transposase [Clostridiales bacterium]
MDKRSKFTKEEKIAIVKRYLEGTIGPTSLAREFGCSRRQLCRWSRGYEAHGEAYFRDSSRHKAYTEEFKIEAVEYFLKTYSVDKAAAKYGISDSVLQKWIKAYKDGTLKDRIPMPEVYSMKGRRTTFEERKEIVHYCLMHDKNYKEAAKIYSLPYSRVFNMVKKYEQEGEEGIMDAKTRNALHPLTEIEKLQRENERLKKELELEKLKRELVQKKISLEKERLQEFKKKLHTKQ